MTSTGLEMGVFDMMSTERTKAVALLTSNLVIIFFACSCSTMKPLRYAVDIINDGKEMIVVEPFEISEGPHATVAVGGVNPGGTAGMSPFYKRPLQTFNISWSVPSTGAKGQVEVRPDLPDAFTKERGITIILRIRPAEERVEVTYEILDPRTGEASIIRQSH